MKIEHIYFDQSNGTNWKVGLAPTRHHILILVVKGNVHYHIDDTTVTLGKGEGLFMPQGTLRSAESDVTDPQQMYSMHFSDLPGAARLFHG